jgi:hypothetical protein
MVSPSNHEWPEVIWPSRPHLEGTHAGLRLQSAAIILGSYLPAGRQG